MARLGCDKTSQKLESVDIINSTIDEQDFI